MKTGDRIAYDEQRCKYINQPMGFPCAPSNQLQQRIRDETERNSIRDAECERHYYNHQESWKGLSKIIPLNVAYRLHH